MVASSESRTACRISGTAGLELVKQLDPCGHHGIGAEAFTFLGACLVGATQVAEEFGSQARRERVKSIEEGGCSRHGERLVAVPGIASRDITLAHPGEVSPEPGDGT